MWHGGLYGAPAAALLTLCEVDGAWAVTLDAPWAPAGVPVGVFPTQFAALAFCYGPPRLQLALPLDVA